MLKLWITTQFIWLYKLIRTRSHGRLSRWCQRFCSIFVMAKCNISTVIASEWICSCERQILKVESRISLIYEIELDDTNFSTYYYGKQLAVAHLFARFRIGKILAVMRQTKLSDLRRIEIALCLPLRWQRYALRCADTLDPVPRLNIVILKVHEYAAMVVRALRIVHLRVAVRPVESVCPLAGCAKRSKYLKLKLHSTINHRRSRFSSILSTSK